MIRRIYLVLLFTGLALSGWSQTSLPAEIERDTVLSIEGSPYYIQQNLVIAQGVTLKIDPGVHCIISNGVLITNNGRFIVSGTNDEKVLFTSNSPEVNWRYISNHGSLFTSHLLIRRATRFVTSFGDTVVVNNCDVAYTSGTIGDDCIGVHNANKVTIRNSSFVGNPEAGKTDALDLDGISGDTIDGNYISGFSDDGIDIGTGSQNIVISENVIDGCDMGISVGENSTAQVSKNLITNCIGGIQSHFGSVTTVQQNTLFGNNTGLRAFHNGGEETSGGTIHISNSIIANCILQVLTQKDNSVVTFNYCLTDSLPLSGTGNITGDPSFINVGNDDFGLAPGSIAIDAGNPDNDNDGIDYRNDPDDIDPDGTRLDLGYNPYFNSPLRFIEISPSNLSLLRDDSGAFSDWFKIVNVSDTIINLNGFYLSDKRENPYKYQIADDLNIPGGDTLIFWANNSVNPYQNYLPFKLSGEGEHLVLSNSKGIRMDQKAFSRVPVNYIYKRVGGSEEWVYSTWPLDEHTITYDSLCSDPVFINHGGASAFPVSVFLSSAYETDSVFYTMDGLAPAEGSLYENSLSIEGPSTLRTVVKMDNCLSGYNQATSYFPEEKFQLPVVSLSTNEDNLYGTNGIYTNYANAGPYWERPASFSYYNADEYFTSITGIRIQGGNSVYMPKKAFRLHFRGGYGASRLEASPFEKGPISFKNLVLRSGYDDDISRYDGTLLRDPFSNELWNNLGELATESSWSILLLNNNYWGIYNLRESINEYFVEDKMGIEDFDLIRFQKWGPDLKYGTWEEWNHLVQYFDTTNFSRVDAYDEVSSFMDMNSLLNLLSLVHCSQFRSWTWGAFVIKPKGERWSWTIWDTDRSYNNLAWNGFTEYAITTAEKWPNFIPQKLIQNEQFKTDLINRNCDFLNSLFIPEQAISVYDSLVSILTPEMDSEYERWNAGKRSSWDTNNESIREFLRSRPSAVYTQMQSYFNLTDTVEIKVRIVGKGKVKLNSLMVDQERWQGTYMAGVAISLEALPAPGSNFIEWEGISNIHFIEVDPGEVQEIIAVFDTSSVADRKEIVINEIMYHPLNPESSEWVELYNPNDYSVSLEGFEFTDGGINNQYIFPSNSIIDPMDFLLVAGDINSFTTEFGENMNVSGSFNVDSSGFKLSNNGENLYLKNAKGEVEDFVQYNDKYPWPEGADGLGPSLQLMATELDNNKASNWFSNTTLPFSPGFHNVVNSNGEEHSENPLEIHIYPNPVGETLFIEVWDKFESNIQIQIFTLTGKNIATSVFKAVEDYGTISWQHGITEPGAYILKVTCLQPEGCFNEAQLIIFTGKH